MNDTKQTPLAGSNLPQAAVEIDHSLPNLQAMVDTFLAAQNEHDIDAITNCFTEDATVTLMVETLKGKAAIREWQENLAADHFHIELGRPMEGDGDRITFVAKVEQERFKALGLAHLDGECEVVIRDGKVGRYTFKLSPESQMRFEAARAKIEPAPESS